MATRYRRKSRARISDRKIRQIMRLFALDLTAVQIAQITNGNFRHTNFQLDLTAVQIAQITHLNRNTVNRYLTMIRRSIALHCESESPFAGEVELDESYFGARRVRGKRGRGARGKTIVFGIYKRNGCVYTEVVPNCSRRTLYAIIKGKVDMHSTILTDGFRSYDSIVDLGYQKHYRIDHGKNEFVRGSAHINGIEGFWGFAKVRLVKFRGLHHSTFYLHLKECEFRFNYRKKNLYSILLKIFNYQ